MSVLSERETNPTPNVASDASVPRTGSIFGKNSLLKTSAAEIP
jgi:hypothetical protein